MARRYTISDGKMVLVLKETDEGGFVVTSPMEPVLITEAETVAEAFEMARDAMKTLTEGRAKLGTPGRRRRDVRGVESITAARLSS